MTDPNRQLLEAIDEVSRSAQVQLEGSRAMLRRQLLVASTVHRRTGRWLALVGGATALTISLASLLHSHRPPLTFVLDDAPGHEGAFIAAENTPRRLAFSDGTEIEVALASRAQVVSIDGRGATIRLDMGRVSARVVHHDATQWRIEAGPYVVRVTGTTFGVAWDPVQLDFEVGLNEGSVEVTGPFVGTRRVHAGERLSLPFRGGPPQAAMDAGVPASRHDGPTDAGPFGRAAASAAVTPPAWLPLARARAWNEAWAKVSRVEHWCATSNADDLLLLADVARFAGHPREAVTVLRAVRRRFPASVSAHEAGYLEGIVHVNALGEPAAGLECFVNAFEAAPDGPLAEEALSRALEIAVSLGRSDARPLAERYLKTFPNGAQRSLARRTVENVPR